MSIDTPSVFDTEALVSRLGRSLVEAMRPHGVDRVIVDADRNGVLGIEISDPPFWTYDRDLARTQIEAVLIEVGCQAEIVFVAAHHSSGVRPKSIASFSWMI